MSFPDYDRSAEYIKSRIACEPKIAIVLGSGLGGLGELVANSVVIDYADIPGFAVSTVPGHAGRLIIGKLSGKDVVLMQGRFHYYEGYDLNTVTLPVRVLRRLGVEILIVTNAAGGINEAMKPSELMLITDHINLTGRNPLRGANDERFGVRFPDMSEAYDRELRAVCEKAAALEGIKLHKGVYLWVTGPSFETPAEIRFFRIIGADAVGMSTVPEVIVANHAGMRVLGISCISNMAAGILPQKLSHKEVMEAGEAARERFTALILQTLELLK